ncbi:MAG: tetratricopeptide repeat protein [Candidatus Hydrogenedentes bacterium]|nr:tetratricopeptide repeat protein [Candidatus Hydrogenedentota bacterium]
MRKKHRIIAVTTLFTVVIVGGGGAVLVRQQMLNSRALENRELGMASIAREDYSNALHQIGSYLQRYGQDKDPEAVYEYARARMNVPLPNGKHIGQAIGLFLQVLSVDPGHREARLDLMKLYSLTGYGQEALDLADKILQDEPENLEALRAKAGALTRNRKFDEALEIARRLTELAPESTRDHVLVLTLMQSNGAETPELLAYPDSQAALNHEQAGYSIIRALALEMAGRRNEATEAAKRAGEIVQPESEDVLLVNTIMAQFGLYSESLNLLARTAPASKNPDLLQFYCQRLFEVGNTPEVLKLTGAEQISTLSSGLLAVRGMAAGREGNKAVLEEVVGELKGRSDDTQADAWAPVLEVVWLRDNASPKEVMDICSAALANDQGNPYFHYFVGLAHERLGERDNALASLQNAIKASPAWIDPILRSATLFAASGGHGEAFALVQAAMQRAPQNAGVAAAGAEIIGANVEGLNEENRAKLFKLCEQVQSVQPFEPRTLPILIHLRALEGNKTAATELVQSALQGDAKLPESTLLKLAQLSDQHGLGLSEACFAKLNSTSGGMTPGLAYAQAVSRLRSGDPEGAKAFLTEAASKGGDDLRWQTAMAQFLDLTGSADALKLWVAIAEKAPDDAALLRTILDSRSAWNDLALIDRVIERLKSATGENAVNWRVARARWMMLSDSSPKAAAEAAALLNETMQISVPEAQRYTLLASALEKLGNIQGAIDSLEQAVQVAPEMAGVHFELARLLSTRGESDRAKAEVEKALASKSLTDEDRRRAAGILARGNDVGRAIGILETFHQEKGDTVPLDLQLAQLYRSAGQLDKAEAIFKRFLAESPNEFAIGLAADLYATQGRKDEALAVLQGLDALELKPGQRPAILAEYNRVHGTVEEAARWYEQAVTEAKSDPNAWRRLLAFLARGGDPAAAVRRIADASAACPEDSAIKDLSAQVPLIQKLLDNNQALPFVLSMFENPGQFKDAVQALESIDKNAGDLAGLASDFKRIADQSRYLLLETQLVRIYSALNRHAEAAEVASRSMREFPEAVEPAVLAAQAYAAAGNWTEALAASQEWRRRAPLGAQSADFMIANAQIQLGQSSEALETIKTYAEESPDNPMVVTRQAQAFIAGGRVEEAENLLRPRLAEPVFRMAWVELATLVIQDEATAARWLNEAAALVPTESLDERGALALAWYQLSDRLKNTAYRDQSRSILEELAKRPDVTADLLFRLGMVYDVSGVAELAEENYKRAISLAPDMIAAKNNLAMRYITSNKNLEEALKLAQEAAVSAPNSANVQDTLSQAHAALGNLDAAITSIQKAAELEPGNRQWTDRLELLKSQQGEGAPAGGGASS